MRYVTVMLEAPGEIHPLEDRLSGESAISREAIHQLDGIQDGTCAMLTELRGDFDRYREVATATESVLQFAVSGDEHGFAYTRFQTNDVVEALLAQYKSSTLLVDVPIEVTGHGQVRFTVVGENEALTSLGEGLPEEVRIRPVEVGTYPPATVRLANPLTDRQREVLSVAVEEGYYESPREATHEDIASVMGIATGTVSEHLQRIERAVLTSVNTL